MLQRVSKFVYVLAHIRPRQSRPKFSLNFHLAALLGRIVVSIYGIRPVASRHVESLHFERLLDKWYLELPEALRYEPGLRQFSPPQPHILTLHMQYWCAVLLLHRPL